VFCSASEREEGPARPERPRRVSTSKLQENAPLLLRKPWDASDPGWLWVQRLSQRTSPESWSPWQTLHGIIVRDEKGVGRTSTEPVGLAQSRIPKDARGCHLWRPQPIIRERAGVLPSAIGFRKSTLEMSWVGFHIVEYISIEFDTGLRSRESLGGLAEGYRLQGQISIPLGQDGHVSHSVDRAGLFRSVLLSVNLPLRVVPLCNLIVFVGCVRWDTVDD